VAIATPDLQERLPWKQPAWRNGSDLRVSVLKTDFVVIRVTTPFGFLGSYRRFGGRYRLSLLPWRWERQLLRNVCWYPPAITKGPECNLTACTFPCTAEQAVAATKMITRY
jgi:hypothetical protein